MRVDLGLLDAVKGVFSDETQYVVIEQGFEVEYDGHEERPIESLRSRR